MYALLGSDNVTLGAVGTIVSSAMSIAFAPTTISVDFDTDPVRRLLGPNYYGYMPNENRLLVFVLMVFMSGSHVLMKLLACSLMLRVNKIWFWMYMAMDMGVYFLYKIARGDFRYWVPFVGIGSWAVSILSRIGIKVITDFTLIVQFRGQMELGGMYWTMNMILNQLFCFISVFLYKRFADTRNTIENAHYEFDFNC